MNALKQAQGIATLCSNEHISRMEHVRACDARLENEILQIQCCGIIVVYIGTCARNGCHGTVGLRYLGLGTRPIAILEYRLLADGLRYLGLGT
jgi:hypothetical protein